MALTVAKAFNMAFKIWEAHTSEKKMAKALRRADCRSESDAGNESDTGITLKLGRGGGEPRAGRRERRTSWTG
jgi:hypothetical protein